MNTLVTAPKAFAGIPMAPVRESKRNINVLIYGDPGVGKGHVSGTLIATPTGWEKIENLRPGSFVIGASGRPVKVLDIYDRGILDVFTVRFHDGAEINCDADHLWFVKDLAQHSRERIVSTATMMSQSLVRGKAYRWSIPLVGPVEYEKKTCYYDSHAEKNGDLTVEPYLLGVLLANGSLTDYTAVGERFSTNDLEIVEYIRERSTACGFNYTVENITARNATALNWRVSCGDALSQLGLRNKLSADKFIPDEYLTAHIEARQELLAGLLDCDSHAATTAAKVTARPIYWTRSKVLAKQVRMLVESLGGVTTLRSDTGRDGKEDWQVHISYLPFNPYRLARKRLVIEQSDELRQQTRNSRRITAIEAAGSGHVYCIRVRGEERVVQYDPTYKRKTGWQPVSKKVPLYVTERYIVTHNTFLAATSDHVPAMRPVLYLNVEGGDMTLRHAAPEVRKLPAEGNLSWPQLESVYHELHRQAYGESIDGEFTPRTVVLDSGTELQKINMAQLMSELVLAEPDKGWDPDIPDLRRWGKSSEQMRRWIRRYRDLPINFIMICHATEDKDNMTGVISHKPQLPGKLANEVAGFFDVVVYLYTKQEELEGKTQTVRKLLTGSLEGYVAKDRSGNLPFSMTNPTMKDMYELITKEKSAT